MTLHDLLNTLGPVGLLALTGTVMMFVGWCWRSSGRATPTAGPQPARP
ncbi:hypothetical protein [Streptomyces kaempferi]|uniref:Uncharacterized protein n=1 Tax=Streptomyces kaempferi TaxID=333725 RepID=A0ABW3XPD7_9ACTN